MADRRSLGEGGQVRLFRGPRIDQPRHRRAEMRVAAVPELGDERMPLERLLDDPALDAFAAAVNEADLPQACVVRRVHVLLDDRFDIPGRERVQVETMFDRDPVRHFTPADTWR